MVALLRLPWGRIFLYAVLVPLALFVLSTVFLLEHGGDARSAIAKYSPHDLRSGAAVVGQDVVTEGELQASTDEGKFELTDGELSIIVVDAEGDEELGQLAGQHVVVVGRTASEPGTGVYVEVDEAYVPGQ